LARITSTYGDVYFLVIDSSVCRSSLERFMLNGLFLGIRDVIALMEAYQIPSPIRLLKYVIVFMNRCTKLDHPVLSGWSYGPLVFLDYIRHYGEDRLGGLQLVGAATKLGSEEAMSVVALHLNRRLWPFTALNSWTGSLSSGFKSWLELYLNRRQPRFLLFPSEVVQQSTI
jgi:hypothetical protein